MAEATARGRARVTPGSPVTGPFPAGHRPRRRAPARPARRARRRAVLVLVGGLALVPTVLTGCGSPAGTDRPPAATTSAASAGGAPAAGGDGPVSGDGSSTPAGKAADPVGLRVPDLGVAAPVVPLDLDGAGRLIAPKGFSEVGWNHAGPEPGDDGVAVIAGHVDSRSGPAVFYRLGELRPGAPVLVDRADGTTATFVVDRLAQYSKANFPDQEVYYSGSGAQLRLITCGGVFNKSSGHYTDNIVVFAHLA
ncbi:class F sortase [Frankia nepalensis]|uniref:class F sortase n=1 Tax=Frankia nepalensis TaxID=1836974 RepID=UPI0027DB6007|nr:class F sortase [Frankia nepalensis]